ncbi:hypothetical protein [Methanoplanus endosymbiosus]|uniref:Uncharacterized protein n=1 Tax=Methanoplanus endosymbiosus TaxID=33865 RepID=A0A9E7TJ65_9EURY|nr:hypothetical protein [Methanoplanus endosymbiosus]UUX93298.1 hypothetical protein L6E24_04010 [Methanoplanus endosymbiosus]
MTGAFWQFVFLVVFVQFLAGFFSGILICEKFKGCAPDTAKFRYYGAFGGFFTGIFILALPLAIASLRFFNSALQFGTLISAFMNFFPFVISGAAAGIIGSLYAGRLVSAGRLNSGYLRKSSIYSILLILLVIFVPVFFGLVFAHQYEPEVIRYGEYDDYDLSLILMSSDGNSISKIGQFNTTYGRSVPVVEMKNGTFAIFGHDYKERGDINYLAFTDHDGITSDKIPILRSPHPVSCGTEIFGTGFAISDEAKNIFIIDYDGSLILHTSVPDDLKRSGNRVEMVYPGGEELFLRWGKYCAFMNFDGNFSDIKSYGESGYSERLYRMNTGGILTSSGGGYFISVIDDDSGRLKVVWLDDSLNFVREEFVGSSHASTVQEYAGKNGDDMVLTEDIIRYDDRPVSEFDRYFRFYNTNTGEYNDVFVDFSSSQEVFEDGISGYDIFTAGDITSVGMSGIYMKSCPFDEEYYDKGCHEGETLIPGSFAGIKIMQTADGGYLCAYTTEKAEVVR